MAISRAFSIDGVTIGASEISVVSGTTTLQTRTETGSFALHVDAAALEKADYYNARYYEKVEAPGGTKRLAFQQTISHAQAELWKLPDMLLKNGWDMTLQKVGGADAVFNADSVWLRVEHPDLPETPEGMPYPVVHPILERISAADAPAVKLTFKWGLPGDDKIYEV